MSDKITLTSTPVQLTDGTNYAHVTVESGYVGYADSQTSTEWHQTDSVLNVGPPFKLWLKATLGSTAAIKVSKATS